MKRPSLYLLSLALPAFALAPGDDVSLDAIRSAEFIKGSAPDSWEKGKLYYLDCWATWCGSCLAAMPGIDALYDKYHDRGLHVIGMNMQEDDKAKVAQFVAKKGDRMSYDVAYVGPEGDFEKDWLQAAQAIGLPQVFLVKDGKLLLMAHPGFIDEQAVIDILAGGEREIAAVKRVHEASEANLRIVEQLLAFTVASGAGDADAMAAALAKIEELDPEFSELAFMRADLSVAREDWPLTRKQYSAISDPAIALAVATTSALRIDGKSAVPPVDVLEWIERALAEGGVPDPMIPALRARILWKLGKKDAALKAAREFAEASATAQIPKEPVEGFVASFESGSPESIAELQRAIQDAQPAGPGQ